MSESAAAKERLAVDKKAAEASMVAADAAKMAAEAALLEQYSKMAASAEGPLKQALEAKIMALLK